MGSRLWTTSATSKLPRAGRSPSWVGMTRWSLTRTASGTQFSGKRSSGWRGSSRRNCVGVALTTEQLATPAGVSDLRTGSSVGWHDGAVSRSPNDSRRGWPCRGRDLSSNHRRTGAGGSADPSQSAEARRMTTPAGVSVGPPASVGFLVVGARSPDQATTVTLVPVPMRLRHRRRPPELGKLAKCKSSRSLRASGSYCSTYTSRPPGRSAHSRAWSDVPPVDPTCSLRQ